MMEKIATNNQMNTESILNFLLTNKKFLMKCINHNLDVSEKEDIFQDTLLSLISAKTTIDTKYPFTYFKTVIRYNARRYFEIKRTNTIRQAPRGVDLFMDFECEYDVINNVRCNKTPEHYLQHKQQIKAINSFMETLPPFQKRAFYSKFFEYKEGAEIAKELGCSYMSAKSNYNLALAKIKKSELKNELQFIPWE